ncbi:hypothetical protein J6590_064034 [Homalodisca vitripennis]|nr:hypothetical protein J6590_064034 [Homalodisca vitripennis]
MWPFKQWLYKIKDIGDVKSPETFVENPLVNDVQKYTCDLQLLQRYIRMVQVHAVIIETRQYNFSIKDLSKALENMADFKPLSHCLNNCHNLCTGQPIHLISDSSYTGACPLVSLPATEVLNESWLKTSLESSI